MARPTKSGLDYFPLDVHIFEDEKIEAIAGEFGIKGELAVIKLLCAVYEKGYFVVWNDLTKAKLLKRLPGTSKDLLDQVVNRLVTWGFFNESLFNSAKVLTSETIQATYFEATKRRKSQKPTQYVINDNINTQATGVNDDINAQSKVNQSKVNKNKKDNHNERSPIRVANEFWGKQRPLNSVLQDAILQWCNSWPNEMVIHAIELAYAQSVDMRGVKPYVNAIFKDWDSKGIDSVEKAKKNKQTKSSHKNAYRQEQLPDHIAHPKTEEEVSAEARQKLIDMGVMVND
ncbi:Lin1244/Lin1753 domain-containing protein [Enterococcus sp. AZ103]|uniref:Lin1244/Lin1753 domain-containing protein n=1 Tax=Enterococcus sp. AZ103 TaxID=2774628 RepID=UPI003F2674CC